MSQYVHPETLVDTKWLEHHLNDPTVRVVEVDTSPDLHKGAHIPGAVFWNIYENLLQPDLRLDLDKTSMQDLLSKSGIEQDTTVVAYGSYPGTGAWIYWLLKLYGHRDVRVLNGGYSKWKVDDRPCASTLSTYSPTQYQIKSMDNTIRALSEDVKKAIAQDNRVLLDVRTLEEFKGERYLMEPPEDAERAGHIPSAVHINHLWTLNDDETFKSADELTTLFQDKGITPDQDVITYCAIGGRSGYMWYVLTHLLGYQKVKNYDGSWNEWSRLPNTPIALA